MDAIRSSAMPVPEVDARLVDDALIATPRDSSLLTPSGVRQRIGLPWSLFHWLIGFQEQAWERRVHCVGVALLMDFGTDSDGNQRGRWRAILPRQVVSRTQVVMQPLTTGDIGAGRLRRLLVAASFQGCRDIDVTAVPLLVPSYQGLHVVFARHGEERRTIHLFARTQTALVPLNMRQVMFDDYGPLLREHASRMSLD